MVCAAEEVPCERAARAAQAAVELFAVAVLLADYLNFCSGERVLVAPGVVETLFFGAGAQVESSVSEIDQRSGKSARYEWQRRVEVVVEM